MSWMLAHLFTVILLHQSGQSSFILEVNADININDDNNTWILVGNETEAHAVYKCSCNDTSCSANCGRDFMRMPGDHDHSSNTGRFNYLPFISALFIVVMLSGLAYLLVNWRRKQTKQNLSTLHEGTNGGIKSQYINTIYNNQIHERPAPPGKPVIGNGMEMNKMTTIYPGKQVTSSSKKVIISDDQLDDVSLSD